MTELTPQPLPFTLPWPPLLEALQQILASGEVYLVGGAVRDAVLRRASHDFDFVTPDDGRKWARRIADRFGGVYFALDAERGVGRALIEHNSQRYIIDVARYRGETLADDLLGRDFTINALAVPMHGSLQEIIDPLGGLADLNQKRLRRCSPQSVAHDPIRALRAVRQSVAFKLMIEPETRQDLRRHAARIRDASPERVRDEFMTMLGGPRPQAALRVMDAVGLLGVIVPEVEPMRGVTQGEHHVYDVWEHTLAVVERLEGVLTTISPARTDETAADSALGMIVYLLDRFRQPLQHHLAVPLPNDRSAQALLILAALLHDCAKPHTRSVGPDGHIHFYQHEHAGAEMAQARGLALRLSNEETARLEAIIRHHMRPLLLSSKPQAQPEPQQAPLSRRAIHRFWNATGVYGVDVCLLTLADYLGRVGPQLDVPAWIAHVQTVGALLDGYFNRKSELVSPPPLLTGHDLMQKLALDPGPEIGRLLALLSEAQAAGEISTADEALALAAKLHADGHTSTL